MLFCRHFAVKTGRLKFAASGVHSVSTLGRRKKLMCSVLNVKALVGDFNQEKALVGAFSVIMKSSRTFVSSSRCHPAQPREQPAMWRGVSTWSLGNCGRCNRYFISQKSYSSTNICSKTFCLWLENQILFKQKNLYNRSYFSSTAFI